MKELNKRLVTAIPLFLILYFSLISYLILSVILLFTVFILFYEFNSIFLKIFKKRNLIHFVLILSILIYLIFFSLSILLFLGSEKNDNTSIFLFLISISISTDLGGYIFGKIFKGKKLTTISPNKTYSGVIGSFILSLTISEFFFKNIDININYLLLTVIISTISQIGDLLISLLKRKAKIKDTGSFLPGHGGLLDRLDGILLALPIGLIIISL